MLLQRFWCQQNVHFKMFHHPAKLHHYMSKLSVLAMLLYHTILIAHHQLKIQTNFEKCLSGLQAGQDIVKHLPQISSTYSPKSTSKSAVGKPTCGKSKELFNQVQHNLCYEALLSYCQSIFQGWKFSQILTTSDTHVLAQHNTEVSLASSKYFKAIFKHYVYSSIYLLFIHVK